MILMMMMMMMMMILTMIWMMMTMIWMMMMMITMIHIASRRMRENSPKNLLLMWLQEIILGQLRLEMPQSKRRLNMKGKQDCYWNLFKTLWSRLRTGHDVLDAVLKTGCCFEFLDANFTVILYLPAFDYPKKNWSIVTVSSMYCVDCSRPVMSTIALLYFNYK